MTRWLSICLAACLAGCAATSAQVPEVEREKPPSEREIAQRQAVLAMGRKMEPTASEKFDVAVVGGACAPKVGAKFAVTACVNEQPCNGFGTRLASGRLACVCYEVQGGCGSGTFCSHRTHQCVRLPSDTYHVP